MGRRDGRKRAAKRRHEQGEVLLSFSVGADGAVLDVEVESSSGSALLDQAALDAARGWSFDPATRDGLAVASNALHRVTFRLEFA